jgi:hypothetical protein
MMRARSPPEPRKPSEAQRLVARRLAPREENKYFVIQSIGRPVVCKRGTGSLWHRRFGMTQWLRRIRGTIGMGLTWAVAGGAVGTIINLGFVVRTSSRPDAPFPIMLGAFGFVAGVVFSGVLRLIEGRRRFDEMSLPRFAAWGAAVGLALSATFFLAVSRGDPAFLQYFVVVGPTVAVAAAGCAAGSLALARRARNRELPEPTEDGPAVGRPAGGARKALRDGR